MTIPPVQESSCRPSFFLQVSLSLGLVASAVVGIPSLLLFLVAARLSSKLFAFSILIVLWLSAWGAVSAMFRRAYPRIPSVLTGLALAMALYVAAVWVTPTGHVPLHSPLTSVYRGERRFSRFSPAWIVDEADQIRLGGILLPYIDPFMSREEAVHFGKVFENVYAELHQSPDFVQIGSAMGEAYADMFFSLDSVGHAYVYRPSHHPSERLPVIVFFHGWLGNLKAYMWAWARFAEQYGFVVICPTFRNGVWEGRSAVEMLRWLDSVIREDPLCDPDHVVVVGLSNGGTGVTQWARVLPQTFSGLVMISSVMWETDNPDFLSAVDSRPILVVHGGKDSRISPSYVRGAVARMRENGLRVQSIGYPEEDHALLLSFSDRLQSDMLRWMQNWERR